MRPRLQVIVRQAQLRERMAFPLSEQTSCESKTNKLRAYILGPLNLEDGLFQSHFSLHHFKSETKSELEVRPARACAKPGTVRPRRCVRGPAAAAGSAGL